MNTKTLTFASIAHLSPRSAAIAALIAAALTSGVAAAKPNYPSAARAQLANARAPMACVVRTVVQADGSIHRLSRCEAVQPKLCDAPRAQTLATGGTVLVCDKVTK